MQNARRIAIFTAGGAVQLLGYGILRSRLDISGATAAILTGITVWSACLFLIGNRIGHAKLTIKDYADLHGLSVAALVVPTFEGLCMLLRQPSGPSLLVVGFAFFPIMALQTLTRRILFSPQEQDSLEAERVRLRHAQRG